MYTKEKRYPFALYKYTTKNNLSLEDAGTKRTKNQPYWTGVAISVYDGVIINQGSAICGGRIQDKYSPILR
ncbi:MAG: hypothetical protein A3H73_03935 [Candidatus Taylorbacteria bacterium RIFCSPLOWO2_02_FULL_50_120]|nr:MAG: hypothetical protein A3H73_03935 [Candidatus Taylorbacteria bacterium RIFCSPLOWO2_02_FULL_50_120]